MAVGVASQRAQGQAITITAAKYKSAVANVESSTVYQITNVTSAITITTGTNIAATESANP